MDTKFFNYPWNYFTIDKFFSSTDFLYVKDLCENLSCYTTDRSSVFFHDDRVHKISRELIANSFDSSFLFQPDDIKYEANFCRQGYSYPIHPDMKSKALSIVVFLSDLGDGTKLYKNTTSESYTHSIEWIPNKAFGFKRTDNTFHSFSADTSDRLTLNIIWFKYE